MKRSAESESEAGVRPRRSIYGFPVAPLILALGGFLVIKFMVAARLDLFGDEAFYWQCAQRLAFSYADHPPMTALLVRLGTALLGDTTLGVRVVFLLMGTATPLVLFLLARDPAALPQGPDPAGEHDGWLAAGAALALPGTALFGLIALPDVAMLLFAALFMLGCERATRLHSTRAWLLTGIAGGLGLATHYRFVLFPAAALVYLLATSQGRRQLAGKGPWLAVPGLFAGLIPAIVYNLTNDFAPVRYYLGGRHGFSFDAGALAEHVGSQALLVSPLLYLVLIGVLIQLARRAFAGDDRAALLLSFAVTVLGLFFFASPFENSGLMTAHWPLSGYLPLLVCLPAALRTFLRRRQAWLRGITLCLVFGLGSVTVSVVLFDLATDTLRIGALRRPFTGWSEAAAETRRYAEQQQPGEKPWLIVADNYKLGTNLKFQLGSDVDIYILDHPKNRKHGRAPQFDTWGIGEPGLGQRAGEDALVVVQWSQTGRGRHDEWMAHVASFFERLEPLGEFRLETAGRSKKYRLFRFYRGVGVSSRTTAVP